MVKSLGDSPTMPTAAKSGCEKASAFPLAVAKLGPHATPSTRAPKRDKNNTTRLS